MFSLRVSDEEPSVDYFNDFPAENYWNLLDEPLYDIGDNQPLVVCPVCARQLSSRKTMYRHIRRIHSWPEEQVQALIKELSTAIEEHKPSVNFNGAGNVQKLPTRIRKSKNKALTVPCPVPGCTESLGYHEALAHHCLQYHANIGAAGQQQDYRLKEIWHSSFEEFEKWMWSLEHNTGSSFVKRTTSRNSDIMYRCHRTGNPPMSYKNEMKRHGHQSRKVQSHCTAFIRFRQFDGYCYSVFCEGHILHELDLVKTWLNKI